MALSFVKKESHLVGGSVVEASQLFFPPSLMVRIKHKRLLTLYTYGENGLSLNDTVRKIECTVAHALL
jgi:hypothetical protein